MELKTTPGRLDPKPVWAVLALLLMSGSGLALDNQTGASADRQEVLMVATLQNSSQGGMPGAPSYWMVIVDEVLLGPSPCAEQIKVVTFQATTPPWGTADADVKEGDKVWINGRYKSGTKGCEVTLQGSDGYYLRKYPQEIRFQGTAVSSRIRTMPGEGSGWTVSVDRVLMGPEPCSDTVDVITSAALFPAVWGSMDPSIEPGDRLEVFAAYQTNPNAGTCSATLYGSKGYYIQKTGS